jgi:16S rRNA (adenine1518-N6/adenine1519-N6)-dimethyltransferase
VRRTSTGSSSPPRLARAGPSLPRVPESAREVAAALEGLAVQPARGRGQSFLADPFVADAEAALVGTRPGEPVVEVGGGLGLLTAALLRRNVGPLTVIESDPRLAAFLRYQFERRIQVIEGDARAVAVPHARVVVGNLPFSVATPLLLRYFASGIPRVVALVQKEVGDRLTAPPGSRTYGRLGILAALYGRMAPFQLVPRSAFFPSPAVDGRIVTFTRREGPLPVRDVPGLEEMLRRLFAARRKQLGNLLPSTVAGLAPALDPDVAAASADWPAGWRRARPEELPPEAYFRLAEVIGRERRSASLPVRRQV